VVQVSAEGTIGHTPVIEPRATVDVLARVELAYVVDQHFCAVLPSAGGGGESGDGGLDGGPSLGSGTTA
jgi:hypothetical protein